MTRISIKLLNAISYLFLIEKKNNKNKLIINKWDLFCSKQNYNRFIEVKFISLLLNIYCSMWEI